MHEAPAVNEPGRPWLARVDATLGIRDVHYAMVALLIGTVVVAALPWLSIGFL